MRRLMFLAAAAFFAFTATAGAEEWEKYDKPVPTKITVRVLSHGAMAMSKDTGVMVVLRDARTGVVLDQGTTEGTPGDEVALLRAGYPRIRGKAGLVKGDKGFVFEDLKAEQKMKEKKWRMPDPLFDIRDERKPEDLKAVVYEAGSDAAKYEATINISKPTLLSVEAYGPLLPRRAMSTIMTSFWAFPGVDITGEGVVLTLRGLIVDLQDSMREAQIKLSDVKDGIPAMFYLRLLSGSQLMANQKMGIPWDSAGVNITVQAYYKGKLYYEDTKTADKLELDAAMYRAMMPLPAGLPEKDIKKEKIKIRVIAFQPELGNTGFDEANIYLND